MRRRSGFTLIELMVAMALTVFVMVILSQAFILAIDTFSGLKGIGDMQVDLRTGMAALRHDLAQPHFDGTRRMSDPDFLGTNHPREGFFVLYQGRPSVVTNSAGTPLNAAPNVYEGLDPDGVPSYLAVNHILHFTSRLRGNRQESYFAASLSTSYTPFMGDEPFTGMTAAEVSDATLSRDPYFASPWAEISYFLLQTGTTEEPENPNSTFGTPLYGLYRVQLVMPPSTEKLNGDAKYNVSQWIYNETNYQPFAGVSSGLYQRLIPDPPGPANTRRPAVDFYSPTDAVKPKDATGVPPRYTRALRPLPPSPSGIPVPALPPSLIWDTTKTPPEPRPRRVGELTMYPSNPPALDPITPYQAFVLARVQDMSAVLPNVTPTASLVVPNVLSFHCQLLKSGAVAFVDPEPDADDAGMPIPDPVTKAQLKTRVYDTGSSSANGVNGPYPIRGVQVTLRVWDAKTRQARQSTVIQDF